MRSQGLGRGYEGLIQAYALGNVDRELLGIWRYGRGETVLSEGEPLSHLLILTEGRARVCCLGEDGRSVLYGFYEGQGMLGEVELMLNCPATTTVEAVTALTCLAVPRLAAEQLKGDAAFAALAARGLAQKLMHSSRMRAAAALYPLRARLCAYIGLVAQEGRFEEKPGALAELLGVSYRHLHRGLEALCAEGLLIRQGRGFAVPDAPALRREGRGCYAPAPLDQ